MIRFLPGSFNADLNDGRDQNKSRSAEEKAGPASSSGQAHPLHEDLKRKIWEVPAAGSVMPPLTEFSLRKEIVEFRAEHNVIAVTFANHAFLGFVLSWVKGLTDCGVTNLLVGKLLYSLPVLSFMSFVVQQAELLVTEAYLAI